MPFKTQVVSHSERWGLEDLTDLVRAKRIDDVRVILLKETMDDTRSGNWSFKTPENHIENALREALLMGYEDMVQLFLDAGISANLSIESESDKCKYRLMHFAATSGNLKTVQLLAEMGAKMYSTEYHSESWEEDAGLRAAVGNGHAELVDYFLEQGASASGMFIHGMGCGITYLAKAAQEGHVQIVEALLHHGANLLNTLSLARVKLFDYGCMEYEYELDKHYQVKNRLLAIEQGFDVLCRNRVKLYHKTSYTPQATDCLTELNGALIDIEKIKSSEAEKNKIIDELVLKLKLFNIVDFDEDRLRIELNMLLVALQQFDKNQAVLIAKRDVLKNTYFSIVKLLMDYALGLNLATENSGMHSLKLFEGLDVSGVNFIGISINGIPITHEMLSHMGVVGAQQAIVSLPDLQQIDENRRVTLLKRLGEAYKKSGELVREDGVVNLVPLSAAARIGDETTVEARLTAGVDPNLNDEQMPWEVPALILATSHGHFDIVKRLLIAHLKHTLFKPMQWVAEAKSQLPQTPEGMGVYFKHGQLFPVPSRFKSNKFSPIFIHSSPDYAEEMMYLYRRFNPTILTSIIDYYMDEAKTKDQHLMMVLKKDGVGSSLSYKVLTSKSKESLRTYLKKSETLDYFPIVFININNEGVIEELIESQYQAIDQGRKLTVEAIQIARAKGHTAIVKHLESGLSVDEKNRDGDTLLHIAVKNIDHQRVIDLLGLHADVNLQNKEGLTAIDIVASQRQSPNNPEGASANEAILALLIKHGANVSPKTLCEAIRANNLKAITMLAPHVDKRAVPRSHLTMGEPLTSPWYLDCISEALGADDCVEILTCLKREGVDFNGSYLEGKTLLYWVIELLRSRHTKQELRISAPVEISFNIQVERLKIVNTIHYLLDNGADANIGSVKGNTPLYSILQDKHLFDLPENGYMNLLSKFTEKGADVNAVCENSSRPLHAAVKSGDVTAANFLITHGCMLDVRNSSGETPLHLAIRGCYSTITASLIAAGADPTLQTIDGISLFELLEQSYKKNKLDLESDYRRHLSQSGEGSYQALGLFGAEPLENVRVTFQRQISELTGHYHRIKSCLQSAIYPVRFAWV